MSCVEKVEISKDRLEALEKLASIAEANARCERWISEHENALLTESNWFTEKLSWSNDEPRLRAYCNPGFSNILPWVQRAHSETQRVQNSMAMVMATGGFSSEWWEYADRYAKEIWLLDPRVDYIAPPGIKQTSNPRECCAIIFRHGPCLGAHVVRNVWKPRTRRSPKKRSEK